MTNTFDEIFGTVKEFAEKAGEKTTELVDLSRIRLEIASINSDIKKRFEKLGSLAYNQSKIGGCSEDISLCIEEIDTLKKRLAECKEKIDSAKKVIRCPECGTANNIIAAYCYVCGAKLTKDEPKADEAETAGDAACEAAAEEAEQTAEDATADEEKAAD